MFRLGVFVALLVALIFAAAETSRAGQYGTPEEAKALLEKAVAAVKQDKAKALDMFNKGEGGFKDRDLYVACANASDGVVTAHPHLKGEQLKQRRLLQGLTRLAGVPLVKVTQVPDRRASSRSYRR